ncbi:MAG: LuxR C-terminal-related transcriptional regulator [Anaerolineaceae bacterium]|jgi:DNA-binding NarL/FixJ family response regulator|nr:LuxR C-terminal-related transcriptional regulator [Anaerolineaceae bacterium]
MTRLIFLPDRKTFILLESPLPPEALTEAVLRGEWQPPSSYGAAGKRAFQATQQGQVVVVTPDEEGLPVISPPDLSRRQCEVLQCLAEGLTNKQIARRLGMSERTVFNHQLALKHSLQVNTLAQAAAVGTMLGLCQPVAGDKGTG